MDRATVAKYADMDDMTPKPPTDRRRGSKIDPYAALVDGWLEADRMLPRKQRHTARRVHDRLRAETGYDGEYTTTLRYVRRWREANRSGSDGYGELVWAPGVAQIDFGVAKARIAGELVDDHCLVVTFPHSNMRYVTSLPGENAECLCHGLIEVFEHIGGVPPVIVMDNATGAGRRNARGEVTPAAVFDAFDIKRSLPRKGDPYDNAVVESTNRPLKKELVYRKPLHHDRAAEAWPQRLRVVVRQPAAPLHPWIPESEGIHRTGTRPLRNCPTRCCQSTRLLFQVAANAYERQSVIYTTNIEFSGWGRVFGDPDMATAIVDRTVHHGRMIRFEGESYRRTHALMG